MGGMGHVPEESSPSEETIADPQAPASCDLTAPASLWNGTFWPADILIAPINCSY